MSATARSYSAACSCVSVAYSFVVTLTYAIGFGLLYMSLRLPYFAQAKATYGLVVMPALALYFADGLAWCDEALELLGKIKPQGG